MPDKSPRKQRGEEPEDDSITPADAVAAPPQPPGPVLLRPEHIYKAVGLLLLVAFVVHYLSPIVRVLLIIFAAVIAAVALNAVVRLVPSQRRWVTGLIGVVILAVIGTVLWFGTPLIFEQVRGLASQLPEMREQVERWEEWLQQNTGVPLDLIGGQATEMIDGAAVGERMLGQARGLLEILVFPLLVLFGGLFAVGKPNERLLTPLLRAVPRNRRPAFERLFALLGQRILGWVRGTLLSMLVIGVLSTIAFYILGLPYALLLGVINGLLEFVPLVGPWVGGVIVVLVAFLHDPQLALWAALTVLIIQQLESNLITPLVMAAVAEVHPFITLFAIVLFGSLFGLLGILLAVPLVLLGWTVIEVLWVERAIDTDEDPIRPIVKE